MSYRATPQPGGADGTGRHEWAWLYVALALALLAVLSFLALAHREALDAPAPLRQLLLDGLVVAMVLLPAFAVRAAEHSALARFASTRRAPARPYIVRRTDMAARADAPITWPVARSSSRMPSTRIRIP